MEKKFIKVNIYEYVKKGLENGDLVPIEAEKFARIIARPGKLGETVISWVVDKYGKELKEKEDVVKLDEQTGKTGWVVTKADENGYPVKDINGHLNQWVIDDSTFRRKYEIDIATSNLYKPIGGPQIFVQLSDNIILEQWGSEMKVEAGGFVNITNVDDIYAISKKDFDDTYQQTGKEISIKTLK